MGFWGKPTSALTPEERQARADYLREWRKKNPGKQKQYQKNHDARNPDKVAAWRKYRQEQWRMSGAGARYRDKLKIDTLTHYGNGTLACVECGFDNPDALCLDHINDDGKAHRAVIGTKVYGALKAQGYPPGLQTLCQNCNWIKETARRRARRFVPPVDTSAGRSGAGA